jgi:hypothetical protein
LQSFSEREVNEAVFSRPTEESSHIKWGTHTIIIIIKKWHPQIK